ncbi:MAG: hypothetical protein PHV32_18310 [Eubacteriales bacterium]|nr:hypothetical protein [Eubacteriales bacterium]
MTKTIKLIIWGREFSLPVEYDCYEGETVTSEQMQALSNFLAHTEWLAKAKDCVESYCKESLMEDAENSKKDNIFSYVKPEYLFIKRDKKRPRVVLVCKYRYDPEHGLAIVFSFDGKVSVGSQDMIL